MEQRQYSNTFSENGHLYNAIHTYRELRWEMTSKEESRRVFIEKYGDPAKWDTSKITNMSSLFYIDYEEDFRVISKIFKHFKSHDYFSLDDILNFLENT